MIAAAQPLAPSVATASGITGGGAAITATSGTTGNASMLLTAAMPSISRVVRIDQLNAAFESAVTEISQDRAADRFLARAGAQERDRSRLEQSVETVSAHAAITLWWPADAQHSRRHIAGGPHPTTAHAFVSVSSMLPDASIRTQSTSPSEYCSCPRATAASASDASPTRPPIRSSRLPRSATRKIPWNRA